MTAALTLRRAASQLAAGGIVVHALEGVWGLACNPFDERAVGRLLSLKRRPAAKGLIVVAASAGEFAPELNALSAASRAAVLDSWPGAETWIVPTQRFSRLVTGQRVAVQGRGAWPAVAVRVPGHAQARALAALFGGPIVSTSANLSGAPPARCELAARRGFGRKAAFVLPGATAGRRGPSRIRVAGDGRVLR